MFSRNFQLYRSVLFLTLLTLISFNVKAAVAAKNEINYECKVATVDYSILFSESNKGKQLIKKLKDKYEPMHKKLKDFNKELTDAEQKLQVDKLSLSLEEFQRESLRIKQGYERLQIDEQLFQESRIKDEDEARKSIQSDIESSIQKVAENLKLNVVLERNSILYGNKKIDITRDALQELNK